MDWPLLTSLDDVLLQVQTGLSGRVLFWGERAGTISSYVAGWMTGKGMDVVVLDGANRFDPYMVSSFAKKVLIHPEDLLRKIRIARAFTCYQMATLIEEKLVPFLSQREKAAPMQKRRVILLGWITPFLDEDVPEREVMPLFERSLRKVEKLSMEGVPFFFFQPSDFFSFRPFPRGRGLRDSKRGYLAKRLSQFSNPVWRIDWDDKGPKMILEKGSVLNIIENCKLQNEKCNFERENFTASW